MDFYILDELLRRIEVIDQYNSLIWTERFDEAGDFELVVRSDRGTRAILTAGKWCAITRSKRVMEIETVVSGVDDDGRAILNVSGRSIEATVLENRTTRHLPLDGTAVPALIYSSSPKNVVDYVFNEQCRNNTVRPTDNIPFLFAGSLYGPGNIPFPNYVIAVDLKPKGLYDFIKETLHPAGLGFRLLRNGDSSQLFFDVYAGSDRTTGQSTNTAVVFSPELDNLTDTKELTSTAGYKNVAYVTAPNGTRVVYADNVSTTISGFERHVLTVDASDIDLAAGAELNAALDRRGKDELAKYQPILAFDGEIPQTGSYQYESDYFLGDLVEMRNADGFANNMRVTEQIFISDQEGIRSYPTLTVNLLITPGSWLSYSASQIWDTTTPYWADV